MVSVGDFFHGLKFLQLFSAARGKLSCSLMRKFKMRPVNKPLFSGLLIFLSLFLILLAGPGSRTAAWG